MNKEDTRKANVFVRIDNKLDGIFDFRMRDIKNAYKIAELVTTFICLSITVTDNSYDKQGYYRVYEGGDIIDEDG